MKSLLLALISTALAALIPALRAADVAYPAPLGEELARKFPYSMAGQVIFSSGNRDYQGSATVVFKRSVLTAAHNLWDSENGWSTNVEFNRARNGVATPNKAFAHRLYVFAGYKTNVQRTGADSLRAFAFDLGGLRFRSEVANGSYAGWRADYRLLTGAAQNVALGYGADRHSGDELLFVEPTLAFDQIYGGFFENSSLTFEGGMSGGPIFADIGSGDFRVVGVIVAGSDDPPTGGIRALNPAAARFLTTYLRY
jgi:V8-like Glu-specific endopeptidase